jgi:hypothetical protein
MVNMYSIDSESDEEEINLNNYHNSEDNYDIFERSNKNKQNEIYSKYVGKNRIYVYLILKFFNPFSKIFFRASTLSNILRYKENRRIIYIFYNEHTKKVTNIKKIIPRK